MSDAPTPDRRPIAARTHPVSIAVAERLVRIGLSANLISLAGMLAGISSGVLLTLTPQVQGTTLRLFWLSAAVLILLRLLCNMFDGMVALASSRRSPVGELYNEIPDRISDAATLIGLGYAVGSSPRLGFLAALLAVFTAYIRAAARVAGAPQDYCGPMAKQQRMFTAIACCLFAALAPGHWQPYIEAAGWSAPVAALLIICFGSALTCTRRLSRAAAYLRRSTPPTAS